MAATALVLGGGGVLGIAWETGVLAGLWAEGVDPRRVQDVVGTSAGALVGARLASGRDPAAWARREAEAAAAPPRERRDREEREERSAPAAGGSAPPRSDPDAVNRIFRIWAGFREPGVEERRRLGALALAAPTPPEERFLLGIARQLDGADWGAALRVTAVDASSGELCVFDSGSGVPLARAVAASCAVPGVYPPVQIGDRRYLDGGVRSGTSADLAARDGSQAVVIVAPLTRRLPGIGKLMQRLLDREVAALRRRGIAVHVVALDAEETRVLGLDLMNPARRGPALEAGSARGRREARAVAELLG